MLSPTHQICLYASVCLKNLCFAVGSMSDQSIKRSQIDVARPFRVPQVMKNARISGVLFMRNALSEAYCSIVNVYLPPLTR